MRIYWFIIFNVFVVVSLSGQNTLGISSADFYEKYTLLFDDTNVVIIDGRTQQKYSTGHLKNAICIDADDENLEALLRENVIRATTVLGYCTTVRRTTQIVQCLNSSKPGKKRSVSSLMEVVIKNSGFPQLWIVRESLLKPVIRKRNLGDVYGFNVSMETVDEIVGTILEKTNSASFSPKGKPNKT